jgi:hypothetical protein
VIRSARGCALGDYGRRGIEALGDIVGLSRAKTAEAVTLFGAMSAGWSSYAGEVPPFANDITDDATPFEYSLALGALAPELRVLVEPQIRPYGLDSNWREATRVLRALADEGVISLAKFETVAHVFRPQGEGARFGLWTALSIQDGSQPLIKAYLNPLVSGAHSACDKVADAFRVLGLNGDSVLELGGTWVPVYWALDLVASPEARAKVYWGGAAGVDDVELLLRRCSNFREGQAAKWLGAILGRSSFEDRPAPVVTHSFRSASPVPVGTLHLPLRFYVASDEDALERVGSLLSTRDRAVLLAAASATKSDVGARAAQLTYVSLTPISDVVRVVVYLAPEAYGRAPGARRVLW